MTDYRVKGAFFENEKEGGPAFTGFVEIDGVKTMMALWPKTSQAGKNYLQVSEDKKKAAALAGSPPPARSPFRPVQGGGPVKPTARPKDDLDSDDIPFSPSH